MDSECARGWLCIYSNLLAFRRLTVFLVPVNERAAGRRGIGPLLDGMDLGKKQYTANFIGVLATRKVRSAVQIGRRKIQLVHETACHSSERFTQHELTIDCLRGLHGMRAERVPLLDHIRANFVWLGAWLSKVVRDGRLLRRE